MDAYVYKDIDTYLCIYIYTYVCVYLCVCIFILRNVKWI